jgi:putative glutathione S-transferase
MTTAIPERYASTIDAAAHGEHPMNTVPVAGRFAGRLSDDPAAEHPAEPGRYHGYGGWVCPRSHRAAIVLALRGLTDIVSMSYVDRFRDGRGWAFRADSGPDPVNGFTLLREAYLASDPAYGGSVTIPVLWDRGRRRIVSNNPDTIDADLAAAFADRSALELAPPALVDDIARTGRDVVALGRSITRAVYRDAAKDELRRRLHDLDASLAGRSYLLGDRLTLADIRLWTVLVRYDVGPNAHGAAGPPLADFDRLWGWARRLYREPAFRTTTDFDAFRAPLTAIPDWR